MSDQLAVPRKYSLNLRVLTRFHLVLDLLNSEFDLKFEIRIVNIDLITLAR